MIQTGNNIHNMNHQDFIRNILALMIKAGRAIPSQMIQVLQGKPLEMAEIAPVLAYINHGRWVADCPFCPGAELIFQDDPTFLCLSCFNQEANFKSLSIAFPLNTNKIEAILEGRPIIGGRNWEPPKTLNALIEENKLGIEGWHRSWTALRTWTTGEIVTAAMLNEQMRDNGLYLKTETDKLDDVSQTDVTGSRALGTDYENATGKIKIITVSATGTGGFVLSAYCENDATPAVLVAKDSQGNGEYACITIVVPPGWYYKFTESGDGSLHKWFEWDFH